MIKNVMFLIYYKLKDLLLIKWWIGNLVLDKLNKKYRIKLF